ncbi:N-acetylmuramoyl-L-alanine amidase [Joostella atrarenae]|uniref:N-acetylmuramoyl-L-alanine amidase n=1 Tax=Joostella atrarenae TaxID=679257 RepID=A0ABS9J2K4_9FLAO|nr:N-acetylmuramoyl-L-alanine amidase [Joostella atrarenae]MCF8714672.1 N-acetylmuramoyl-L-alanine amidase [Joostella atrarenae]
MNALKQVSISLFCLLFFNFPSAQNGKNKTRNLVVVIDPGHGGKDAGAKTRNGVKEKDIAMGVASKIVELNNTLYNKPLQIFLTRYTDTLIALGDRVRLSNKLKADVFISLHCNHATNRAASGTEIYIFPKSEVQIEASTNLGVTIQNGLTAILGIKSRGVKKGNFQVLRDNISDNASILLELGFLSQIDEAIYLSKEDSQSAVALVILQSITKYLGI